MNNPTPTSNHWTLRFKHGRTTVLIAALPVTHFTTLKMDVLAAIQASGKSTLSGHSIEKARPEDIELGVPVDKWNLQKGWVPLEIDEDGVDDEIEDGSRSKSKGKLKVEKTVNSTPKGAGLKDGAVLAFRFRGDGDHWDVEIPSYDEDQSGEAMDED